MIKKETKKGWRKQIQARCLEDWDNRVRGLYGSYLEQHVVIDRVKDTVFYDDELLKMSIQSFCNREGIENTSKVKEENKGLFEEFSVSDLDVPNDLISAVTKISKVLKEVEEEYVKCKEKHSYLDKMYVDLTHRAELENLNASDGAKLFKEIKSTLKLRRIYKDKIDYLIEFRNHLNIGNAKKCQSEIAKLRNKKDKRTYKNRVTDDVKQELLDEYDKLL